MCCQPPDVEAQNIYLQGRIQELEASLATITSESQRGWARVQELEAALREIARIAETDEGTGYIYDIARAALSSPRIAEGTRPSPR